jgi:hypothetical protein
VELQRKLLEIARPTPLNQQAIQRMGHRKSNEDDQQNLIGKNKLWVLDRFCFSCTVKHIQRVEPCSQHSVYTFRGICTKSVPVENWTQINALIVQLLNRLANARPIVHSGLLKIYLHQFTVMQEYNFSEIFFFCDSRETICIFVTLRDRPSQNWNELECTTRWQFNGNFWLF